MVLQALNALWVCIAIADCRTCSIIRLYLFSRGPYLIRFLQLPEGPGYFGTVMTSDEVPMEFPSACAFRSMFWASRLGTDGRELS